MPRHLFLTGDIQVGKSTIQPCSCRDCGSGLRVSNGRGAERKRGSNIMDELGWMESSAYAFQDAVLDGNTPVLGVVRDIMRLRVYGT